MWPMKEKEIYSSSYPPYLAVKCAVTILFLTSTPVDKATDLSRAKIGEFWLVFQ